MASDYAARGSRLRNQNVIGGFWRTTDLQNFLPTLALRLAAPTLNEDSPKLTETHGQPRGWPPEPLKGNNSRLFVFLLSTDDLRFNKLTIAQKDQTR